MWSNISAPKSGLKAAQVGQQVQNSAGSEETCKTRPRAVDERQQEQENTGERQFWSPRRVAGQSASGQSPLMRYKHAVCSAQSTGHIYIHGGRFANGVPLDDDLWRFDPHENSWTQLSTTGCRPPSLQEHTLVEHARRLYLFGGQVSAASGQENFFWRLDLDSLEWSSLNLKGSKKLGAYLGPTNRRGHSACLYRESLYIFGGFEDFRGSTNQLWQYDLANERWELRDLSSSSACHPEARHNHSAVVYQDSMYVYGGLSNLQPLADLWRWSWRDKRWYRERTRGQGPGALHGHSAIQAFGSMFVFGGERQNGRTTRSLWRLELANLCWHKIKAKGPRPNPTTWHAAVANPLSVLDESNYLIEGETSDAEPEHQQAEQRMLIDHQHPQERQSKSDNCFSTAATTAGQPRQSVPVESVRPPATADWQSLAKVGKSSSEHQMASNCSALAGGSSSGQSRLVKSRRRLKLSFLKRARKQQPLQLGRAGQTEAKAIPTSRSAASILAGSTTTNASKSSQPLKKRHSVQISEVSCPEVEMSDAGGPQPGRLRAARHPAVGILDSLDSDIKQMFARALSPGRPPADGLSRDSPSQSQLSSCLAGATTQTQTYQTAREQLGSQSTLVSSGGAGGDATARAEQHQAKLADVRQRRSMQQVAGRPKSEIVQSLIDRADARIKHLYTPYFNPEQHRARQRNSGGARQEDPLLGQLARHPMFGPAGGRLADKSKRHTIHQTMTYYSLFFSEQLDSCGDSPLRSGKPTGRRPSGESATSTTSSELLARFQPARSSNHQRGTSAALVGVHEGDPAPSGPESPCQRTGRDESSQLDCELASLVHSSDSRTLCDNLGLAPECSTSDHRRRQQPQPAEGVRQFRGPADDQSTGPRENIASPLQGDDTSMSFSMIAEFEEDDMLQYSSPTEPADGRHDSRGSSGLGRDEKEEDEDEAPPLKHFSYDDDDGDDDDDQPKLALARGDRNASNFFLGSNQDALRADSKSRLLAAQKSTSSGYESIRSSNGVIAPLLAHSQPPSNATDDYSQTTSTSGSGGGCSLGTGSPPDQQLHQQHGSRQANGANCAKSALASATSESLASHPSRSLPSSPAANARGQSVLTSLMSGGSRLGLFGRKRTKTRYWQLCMFVLGGKQEGGHHQGAGSCEQPITIWRLYI